LLQTILDNSLVNIYAAKAVRHSTTGQVLDFQIYFYNTAFLKQVRLTQDQLEKGTLRSLFPVLEQSGFLARYKAVVETGEPFVGEQEYAGPNGHFWYQTTVKKYNDGIVVNFVGITDLKQTQLQVEQLNTQLQRSNQSLEQFATIASHDLQEPLRKIIMFGDLLQDRHGPTLPEDARGLLKRMQVSADRMRLLIHDVLTYAQLTKEGTALRQLVDLNRLVAEVLDDLELVVTEKQAIIEAGDLPVLSGHALQLRQVFQNLLSNALKFAKPGRQPHITVQSERLDGTALPIDILNRLPPEADQSATAGRQYYAIRVADNGIGFAAQYGEQIFDAFERLHGTSSAYSGTGIGLAIVRQVANNHDGAVVAQGVEGEGATITLYLPVNPILVKLS
jgi:signal transduction histidine kinase